MSVQGSQKERLSLSWSQSIVDKQTQEFATQEILTQHENTQLGDEEGPLSPLPPYSPSKLPWGRLMPCKGGPSIDLLRENDTVVLGRSHKCDVPITPPPKTSNKEDTARREWAYGMVSNKHCRIFYCNNLGNHHSTEVYIEDTSGNGTLINRTTLLRRGEKRLLHSGDEITLVNPRTLSKKIKSHAILQALLQQHSYIFVTQQQLSLHSTVVRSNRKPAVDPRSMKDYHHRWPSATSSFPMNHASSQSSSVSQNHHRRISPRRQEPRRIETDYDIRELLGSGTVGEVRRAIDRTTGESRAVKIISVRNNHFFKSNPATFEAEATILQQLEHPYIVKLVDFYVSPTAVYMVMELLQGGDLFDRIVSKGKYTETEARRVMRRLLAAIFYLHEERSIVHRDLKPENILLQGDSNVAIQLTDFGLAKSVSGEEGLKTFCGTPLYFAPEILQRRNTVFGRGRYGKQADMWSLGIILYVLLSGIPPFDVGMFGMVEDQTVDFPEEHWEGVSKEARDLVLQLLVKDPKQRLNVRDACNHEWINQEDGDTHCHPLDDPKLSVSQKRLFPLATEDSRLSLPAADEEEDEDDAKPAAVEKSLSIAAHDETIDNESSTVPVSKVAFEEPVAEVAAAATRGSSSDSVMVQFGGACDDKEGEEPLYKDESKMAEEKTTSEPTVDAVETEKDVLDSVDHAAMLPPPAVKENASPAVASAQQKDDEESPGLHAETTHERRRLSPQRDPLTEVPLPFEKEATASETTTREGRVEELKLELPFMKSKQKENDDTPGISNRRAAKVSTESKVHAAFATELSDDEIFSQFSEQSDSIDSFETASDPIETKDEEQQNVDDQALATLTPAPTKEASVNPRKRRVTASVGVKTKEEATFSSSSKKAKTKARPTAAGKRKGRSKAKAPPSSDKETDSDATSGRIKQTTLSNWFTKHN